LPAEFGRGGAEPVELQGLDGQALLLQLRQRMPEAGFIVRHGQAGQPARAGRRHPLDGFGPMAGHQPGYDLRLEGSRDAGT
jgi:hypothetical protein